jgi:farnesyl diphosphate synthase
MSFVQLLDDSFNGLVDKWLESLVKESPDLPQYLVDRHRKMAQYNCVGGKYFRGTQVINFAKLAAEKTGLDFETEVKPRAVALGWAVEALQAAFLVADDIMDSSTTRRGRPCWYLVEGVKMDAVNDALILETFMQFLIEYACEGLPVEVYVQTLKLYLQTCQRTQMGQTLDLLSMPQGAKCKDVISSYNLETYKRIVKYKTAFYTFSLPMCAGLVIGGIRDNAVLLATEEVCIEIGEKFQIQDDYLDCYQSPEILGKIGTDIENAKLSWLCVQALQRMTPEQREIFEANYGFDDAEKVAIIKQMYETLGMKDIYNTQEDESLKRVYGLIEKYNQLLVPSWFDQVIAMVHNRQK